MSAYSAVIHDFLSSFGCPAYPSASTPEDAHFPYITYDLVLDGWGSDTTMMVNLWCRTESEAEPNRIVDSIFERLGMGGVILTFDGGAVWVKRGSPFSQALANQPDTLIKRRLISMELEYIA